MKRLFSGSAWLLLEKGLRLLSGILISALVARHLGPSEYGVLAVALGLAYVFTAGASMGAEHINIAQLARTERGEAATYLASALVVRVLWSAICLVAFLLFIFNAGPERELAAILSLLVPLSAASIFGSKMQAEGRFANYARITTASILVGGAMRVVGVLEDAPAYFFAIVAVCETALASSLMASAAIGSPMEWAKLKPSREQCRAYFRLCLPTAVSAVLVASYLRVELFIIRAELGAEAAGLWATILMFITPWSMIAGSILPVVNRQVASVRLQSDMDRQIVGVLRAMLLIAAAAVVVNWAFASVAMSVLFGPRYQAAADLVPFASIAILPLFMGSAQELWIAHRQSTRVVLWKVTIGLPASAVAQTIFIRLWGLQGAVLAMIVSYFFTAIVLNIIFDRDFARLQLRALGLPYARNH